MRKKSLRTKIRLFSIVCMFFPLWILAQQPQKSADTTVLPLKNSSTTTAIDTLGKDSLSVNIVKNVSISKDALDDPVTYEAQDSIIMDNKNNLVHLYRNAIVRFQTIEVKAGYIVLNIKENLALAEPLKEKSGALVGVPDFKDKDQAFRANKMRYNFKSKKGIIYDVQTQQQNLYVLGEKTKFVSRDATKDTTDTDIIYSKDAILTTCNDAHPHYGIRANKLKVLANKLVVVGPSNLEIAGVPTPLWLPFGFYPISKNKHTGLLFPKEYGFQPRLGVGVQGLGWYFPLGKHYSLQVRSDYYTRGTWGLYTITDYKYRYRFSGSAQLSYNVTADPEKVSELKTPKTKIFSFRWDHRQDAAARPNQTFSANVNISTNATSIQRNLSYDYANATRNILTSGINFARQFPSKPYSFNAGFTHNQNTSTHQMDLMLTSSFPTQAMFPFRKMKSASLPEGVNDFFDQFSINYKAVAEAKLNTIDSLLLQKDTWSKVRKGINHSASINAPVKVLKYITLSPNANFEQSLFFDRVKKTYKDTIIGTTRGQVDTKIINQLSPVSSFNTGVSFNTTLFGTKQFRRGFIRGFRHKLNISGGFSYAPILLKQSWFDSVQTSRTLSSGGNQTISYQYYNIFEGGSNNRLSNTYNPNQKASKTLYFNFGNTLEAKIRRRDTTVKFPILQNFNIPISFNLANDSMKMAHPITMGLVNTFFKGLINVQLGWNVTPYERIKNKNGNWVYINKRVRQTQTLTHIGNLRVPKPFNLDNGNLNVGTNFTIRQLKEIFVKKDTATSKIAIKPSTQNPNDKNFITDLPSILSLIENFSVRYNYAINFNRNTFSGRDTVYTSAHQVGIGGSIPLSKNWNFNIGNIGYDFKNKGLPYIDLGISRDLHCWELAGSWQPTRNSFFFTLRVKQSPLDFLKLPIQKGTQNTFGGFR